MGYADRDYARQPRGGFGGGGGSGGPMLVGSSSPRHWLYSYWLIAINVAIYVLDAILAKSGGGRPLHAWGYFSAEMAFEHGQVWRVITYEFLHADAGHIFANMLGLFWFGPMVEYYLGSRRFLAMYLLCGLAGVGMYLALWGLGTVLPELPGTLHHAASKGMVGASAGVVGVVIAAARVAPNAMVLFMMIVPMRLRTLAWVTVLMDLAMVLSNNWNAGGSAGHLGGAAAGLLLITWPRSLDFADRFRLPRLPRRSGGGASPRTRVGRREQEQAQRQQEQIDRILAKIHEHGLHSLTDREKRILQEATERQRGG